LDILLSAAYLPSIPIGFKFLDQLDVGITVKLELPRLDLRLSNRDANCNALEPTDLAPTNTTNTTSVNDPKAALSDLLTAIGSLVLVEANVSVSLDVAADFVFPGLPDGLNAFNTAVNIFETTIQLLTSCLDPANGFALATGVSVIPTPTIIAGPGSVVATGSFNLPTDTAACSIKIVTVTLPYVAPPIPSATSEVIVVSTIIEVGEPAPTSIIVGGGGYAPPANATIPISSNASGTGGYTVPSPTAPQEFTGAATPGAFAPTLNWRGAGWQAMVLGVSFVAGVMMLL
jgi:hypothetical protein